METKTKVHAIVSEREQFAIVNALAFYHEFHSNDYLDEDTLEQYKLAFNEDNYPVDFVDNLATKIANLK